MNPTGKTVTLDDVARAAGVTPAGERRAGERFGDFFVRVGLVRPVTNAARDFHEPTNPI